MHIHTEHYHVDMLALAMIVKNGLVGDWRLSDEEFTASFHLPHACDRAETLKAANPFPSDEVIHFDEESSLTHTQIMALSSRSL